MVTAVCKGVSGYIPHRTTALGEGLCLQWLLYESSTLGFFGGEGERSQLCAERQQVSASAWAVGDMKALAFPHRWYWRFGWKENLETWIEINVLALSHVLADVGVTRSSRLKVLAAEQWDMRL